MEAYRCCYSTVLFFGGDLFSILEVTFSLYEAWVWLVWWNKYRSRNTTAIINSLKVQFNPRKYETAMHFSNPVLLALSFPFKLLEAAEGYPFVVSNVPTTELANFQAGGNLQGQMPLFCTVVRADSGVLTRRLCTSHFANCEDE